MLSNLIKSSLIKYLDFVSTNRVHRLMNFDKMLASRAIKQNYQPDFAVVRSLSSLLVLGEHRLQTHRKYRLFAKLLYFKADRPGKVSASCKRLP